MKNIKITAQPDILQVLQAFCRASLANPGHDPKTGLCTYYVLQEWAMRNISKLHPTTMHPVKFSLCRSEAVAIYVFFQNLGLTDHEQDFERNNLLDSIQRQMPHLINRTL